MNSNVFEINKEQFLTKFLRASLKTSKSFHGYNVGPLQKKKESESRRNFTWNTYGSKTGPVVGILVDFLVALLIRNLCGH